MTALPAGAQIGPYRIERVLGEGGMGIVYLVTPPDGDPVVLKVLKSELTRDPAYRRRFEHEARIAQEVQHPALVPILESGAADGYQYLTMPFVGTVTLRERIAEARQLPVKETLRVAGALGGGLDALHARGLVHRDVKPSNVLVDDGTSRPLLCDFGIAKGVGYTVLTRTGQMVGTLDYLAPELIRGGEASAASDVYAMACLLYECFVGEPPFSDRPLFQVCFAHLQEPVPDPRLRREDLPAELSETLLRGLEKEVGDRPESAGIYARLLVLAGKLAAPRVP